MDNAEVQQGDEVTFSIEAWTTTGRWGAIDITDELPDGFVFVDATCNVVPIEATPYSCFTRTGSTIEVNLVGVPGEDDEMVGVPVQVILTVTGTINAVSGSTIVNEACSIRTGAQETIDVPALLSMGDPTIPGGGLICADASVTLLQPVVTPSPTASPTETPTTPTETPVTPTETPTTPTATPVTPTEVPSTPTEAPGTPTVPATDTATSTTTPVTGLPSTGAGTGFGSGVMFLAGIAASAMTLAGIAAINRRSMR